MHVRAKFLVFFTSEPQLAFFTHQGAQYSDFQEGWAWQPQFSNFHVTGSGDPVRMQILIQYHVLWGGRGSLPFWHVLSWCFCCWFPGQSLSSEAPECKAEGKKALFMAFLRGQWNLERGAPKCNVKRTCCLPALSFGQQCDPITMWQRCTLSIGPVPKTLKI